MAVIGIIKAPRLILALPAPANVLPVIKIEMSPRLIVEKGCKIKNIVTVSTTIYTGLTCTYNSSCTCVLATSTFITGVNTQFSTTSPLLWGTQYGSGDLVRIFNNSASTTAAFVVDNSGKVAIGANTTSLGFTLLVNGTMYAATGTFDNLIVSSSINILGSANIIGAAQFSATFNVSGTSTLATTTATQLTVNGTSTLNTVSITGPVSLITTTIQNLTVYNTSTLNNLSVTGNSTFATATITN